MIVERAEHPDWLSNAYLVAEGPGGHGVLVDGNGVVEPLLERVERDGITITHVLRTHGHADHVVDLPDLAARFGAPLLGWGDGLEDGTVVESGELEIRALHTPGHARDHLALLVDGTDCLTADVLFRGTVGGSAGPGGSYDELRRSIMDTLMTLPAAPRVHPGHREPTTIGEEWDANPFVRVWRGLDPEGTETCRVGGREATLVLWAPDYDGGHKAWVRFADGKDAIVGGSRVERG